MKDQSIGRRGKDIRISLGLSVKEVSIDLGVSYERVRQMEMQGVESISIVVKWASILKCKPGYLAFGE